MKRFFFIGLVLLGFLTACIKTPEMVEKPVPAEGAVAELSAIDSLMWWRSDSAFAMLQEFASGAAADSLDKFNGHYCQVLIAELLYKNDYGQSNRTELQQAVAYFDRLTLTQNDNPHKDNRHCGLDPQSPNRNDNLVFLDARAHYINGVGFYERDSVVEACGEYLKALEIMETHFPSVETVCTPSLPIAHLPRFIGLIYGRLTEMFSGQFMQEPAIVCCRKALDFNEIEPGSPLNQSILLFLLGKQYDKLNKNDSAAYYYDEALRMLPDTNNLVYRDLVSQMALFNYEMGKDVELSIRDLKRMVRQAPDENERMVRYLSLGSIYADIGQYDSALVYLTPLFENQEDVARQKVAAPILREIYQSRGDTVKAAQCALFLAENTAIRGERNAQVSQLNEMFQNHLEWERERAEAERRQAEQLAAQQHRKKGLTMAAIGLLMLGFGLWWWLARQKREREAEAQTWQEKQQQLQTQVDKAAQQARAMLPQRASDLYHSDVPNRLERIMAEFEAAYPKALEQLTAAYPELSEVERQIAVLNFLHFRAKEEADLTGYTEGTTLKYRSNLNKKAGSDPISALLA
jgi:tetratricopeptide (TPR) repeat protein